MTTSRYGSVSPSAPVPGSDKLYMTTYTLGGYRLSHQRMDGDSMQRIAYSRLPENIVNPPRRKWDVVNLDTVRLARTIDSTHRVKRYRKGCTCSIRTVGRPGVSTRRKSPMRTSSI